MRKAVNSRMQDLPTPLLQRWRNGRHFGVTEGLFHDQAVAALMFCNDHTAQLVSKKIMWDEPKAPINIEAASTLRISMALSWGKRYHRLSNEQEIHASAIDIFGRDSHRCFGY